MADGPEEPGVVVPGVVPGVVLGGRYRLGEVVGEGGMGTVHAAERLDGGGRVAIKRLHRHLVEDTKIAARFRREALAADAIGHPNIVDVLELGESDDGGLFMVLELLEGRDLAADIGARGPLRVGRLVRILGQVCDALEAVHGAGIVHRDLKPENVFLLEKDGDPDFVKILDFGISKFLESVDGAVTSMTRTGTTVGTPYYMAPEQAQGKKGVDHRVDVYALGVIAFRALTGMHPFDDESYPMLVLKICTEAPPPVTRYRADVPMDLDAVIRKCLAKEPGARFANAREVKDALAPFAGIAHEPRVTNAPATSQSAARVLRVDSPEAHAATAPASAVAGQWASGPGFDAVPAPGPEDIRNGDDDREDQDDDELVAMTTRVNRGHGGQGDGGRKGRGLRFGLLGLGVVVLGLVGLLMFAGDDDEVVEETPALPEPAAVEVRALGAGGGGSGDWSWINPRPQAMPTWYDVAVAGEDRVVMVGHAGQAARFESAGLFFWPTDTVETLHGVEWYGPREAVAVGNGGTIRVLTLGAGPRALDAGIAADLRDVAVVASAEGWIVGDDGTLLRLAGYEVNSVDSGVDADLLDVFGAGDSVWVAGASGTILRVSNDGVEAQTSGTDRTLRAIGGCPGGALYAAGDDGKLLRSRRGVWSTVRHELRENLMAIGCDGDRAVISGNRGSVLLAVGRDTVALESGIEQALHGVSGAHGAPTWVVGDGGRLFNLAGDHLLALTDGPTAPLWDIAAISGALVAVGDWGRIVREHEAGFVIADTPTDDALAALAVLGPSQLLAVGDHGAVVSIRHDAAENVDSPSDASLRSVIANPDTGAVLAVGTGGVVLRGHVGGLTASRVADVATLWDVDGRPADALAVGDDGLILAIDHHRSIRVPCPVEASLRAVLRRGEVAWAVGTGSSIVRIEGGTCIIEHPPTAGMPILNDIGLGPRGLPMAVGNLGVAIERGADGEWASVGLAVGRANLRAIRRIDRHVYVVGAGGVILRSIIADGT